MNRTDAQDLHEWASRLQARSKLPELIRRLIHASGAALNRIDFPAGEGVQRPGWDGWVECALENPWVPQGVSVWEMGTDQKPANKANKDYRKRTGQPGDVDPASTTFVFVTPRNWSGKRNWVQAHLEEKVWKAVRVYDAQDLEQWLEQVPAVHAWLGELLGKRIPGLRSLEDYWSGFLASTNPPMQAGVILADRPEQRQKLTEWLSGPPGLLEIRADSSAEGLAFIAATLDTLSDEQKNIWLPKTLIIEESESWRPLLAHRNTLLLILAKGDVAAAGQLQGAGHFVLVPLGRESRESGKVLVLPRPSREALVKALSTTGLHEPRAKTLAYECGRSLLVLQRRLVVAPALATPLWAKPENAGMLTAALLAGGWSEDMEGDRDVLSRLAGRPYPELARVLNQWLYVSDPPLRQVGTVWRLTAPLDAWLLIGRYLTSSELDRFRTVLLEVLSFSDPSFDLPADKRWAANVYGKSWPHSGWLREGLVESLVLLAIFGEQAQVEMQGRPEDWVHGIVWKLLDQASGLRWASVEPLLPLLAEAAPDAFLSAVENSLESDDPPILFLFQNEEPPLGRCLHAGLLWALENLAWSPRYLSRVAAILGALSRLDPGGTWSNRPSASLHDIFLAWRHHTAAKPNQKLAAIDYLCRAEPQEGWKLMVSLLPSGHDLTSGTHEPRWRDWAQQAEQTVTTVEYSHYVLAIIDRLLAAFGESGTRRADLLKHLADLPDAHQERLIEDLEAFAKHSGTEEDSLVLWNALRNLLHRHRSFPDAEWSLPEGILGRLESIYRRLEPDNMISRLDWLFANDQPLLPEGKRRDYQRYQGLVEQARRDAVLVIFNSNGTDALLRFAAAVDHSYALGYHTAEVLATEEMDTQVFQNALGNSDKNLANFAYGFIIRRREIGPDNWFENVFALMETEAWNTAKQVDLCLALPVNRKTWERVHALGTEVEEGYWRRVSLWRLDGSVQELRFAVEQLLTVDRPEAACRLIEFSNTVGLPFDLLAQVLEQLFMKASQEKIPQLNDYEVEQVFTALDTAPDKDEQRIASLEWQYLPIFKRSRRGAKVLHQALTDDPAFFAQVVAWIRRPDSGEPEAPDELPEEALRNRAHLAYDLLHSWRGLPGRTESELDGNCLENWVLKAREHLAKSGHREVGDRRVGEVLARVPTGEDEIWPAIPVRDLIERIHSRALEEGIYLGVMNSRGMTCRNPGEGGKQEQELETRYRVWAEKTAASWPRTSSILNMIADDYAADAKRWDESARRDDLKFG